MKRARDAARQEAYEGALKEAKQIAGRQGCTCDDPTAEYRYLPTAVHVRIAHDAGCPCIKLGEKQKGSLTSPALG